MSARPTTHSPSHELPPLPYAEDALAPVISARTVGLHHGKHQRGYVDTLNKLIAGTPYAEMRLEDIITATAGQADEVPVFNNAAQAWNHDFYWKSLRPDGGGVPPLSIRPLIEASFESVDACNAMLADAAIKHFGSGWAWLVLERGKLKVITTVNAEVPATRGLRPLLAIDVWEHAYYLDWENRRPEHVRAVIDRLVDWGFAADNLG
ncbi:superoxide dismutase [uncultured Methylibium sp.]|uniref:superoxide dismutase n=1 Tax=uncultured Methylibium sp. TaxID=381093 RepID=UPI0025FC8360|nr:superoxide dismutase [uncultured Methylibium sp.]